MQEGVEILAERDVEIAEILRFIDSHPESYASLAVCRRALDGGLDRVTADTVARLQSYLEEYASDEEVEAFYTIIS